jgi:hypothetical protein
MLEFHRIYAILGVVLSWKFDKYYQYKEIIKKQEIFFQKRKFCACIDVEKLSIFASRFCRTFSMIPPDQLHPRFRMIRICLFFTPCSIPMDKTIGFSSVTTIMGSYSFGKEYPIG